MIANNKDRIEKAEAMIQQTMNMIGKQEASTSEVLAINIV